MAGGAYAAKPKVKWGGAIEFTAGGSDQDIEKKAFGGSAGVASGAASLGYAFRTNSEIKFNASGKTDAGMKWKAEVQLETDTSVSAIQSAGDDDNADKGFGDETVIDELWIRFSGSWGQIIVGNQDGVEDAYLTNDGYSAGAAGDGGTDGNWQDFIDARPTNSRLFDEPDDIAQSSDATKIIYYTPRVGGFSAGVGWTPDRGSHGQAIGTDDHTELGGQTTSSTNNFGVGVKYKGKFDKVKVQVSGVVYSGDAKVETVEDPLSWAVGIGLGYGGFRAAFGYMDNGDSFQKKSDTFDNDAFAWSAGIGYSQGPVHLAVSWLHSEVEIDPSDGPDNDESDTIIVGATYMLGGGAKIFGEVFWLDQDSGEDPVSSSENEGIGFLVGVGVKW
jgi:predicted porin